MQPFPLTDGEWAGKRCFVVGGGPSLKSFDWSLLKNDLWVGTNASFVHHPTISFCADNKLLKLIKDSQTYLNQPGIKVWFKKLVTRLDPIPPADVSVIHACDRRWSYTIKDGLCHGLSIAPSAINLADLLVGPTGTIYLLGFDFKGENGVTSNWHSDLYKKTWALEDSVYLTFRADLARYHGKTQAKVINISFGDVTTLRTWPVITEFPS